MANNANGAVVRVHKTKDYTIMSNNHLLNKDLSLKAKGLMSLILALPDDWNYSIGGLTTMSNDGRDAVSSTLKTLQQFGYVAIEKVREQGQFKSIYHIFENPDENIFTDTENPLRLNRCSSADSENPIQQNTNNQETNNKDTNNQLIENASVFGAFDLFELYKKSCPNFPQPREFSEDRKKKTIARLKKKPAREYWEQVFKNANESKFCRENKFFTFDWLVKNDLNARKVFEGNYSDNKYSNTNVVNFATSTTTTSKYESYHQKQNAGL